MSRPFDASRYARLLEGLEITEIKLNAINAEIRIEAEFFRKRYIHESTALARLPSLRLGEFSAVTDGPHGYHEVDDSSPIAMLTAKSASDWFTTRVGADRIAARVDEVNKRSRLVESDVVLSTRGTVGMCAFVTSESLPANIDQDIARISWADKKSLKPEYVVAYLNCRFGQHHISRHASGMVQQGLSLAKVREIPIPRCGDAVENTVADFVFMALSARRQALVDINNAENALTAALGIADWQPPEPLTYTRRASEAFTASRFDAEFFHPAKQSYMNRLSALPGEPLGDHYASVREMFDPIKAGADEQVRDFDLTDALQSVLDDQREPMSAREVGSTKKRFKVGDVVTSRLRAYLRETALVRTSLDVPSVGSSEFIVLRPTRAEPPLLSRACLLTFLRSRPVQTILHWSQDGSHHPRYGDEDLLSIPVPDVVCSVSSEIDVLFEKVLTARGRARDFLTAAQRAVEIAIEDSEAAALAYLAERTDNLKATRY